MANWPDKGTRPQTDDMAIVLAFIKGLDYDRSDARECSDHDYKVREESKCSRCWQVPDPSLKSMLAFDALSIISFKVLSIRPRASKCALRWNY